MSKNSQSNSGLSKMEIQDLTSHLSIAKGMLATLETWDASLWTRRLARKTGAEHTRILLQEAMEEIWNAERILEKTITA